MVGPAVMFSRLSLVTFTDEDNSISVTSCAVVDAVLFTCLSVVCGTLETTVSGDLVRPETTPVNSLPVVVSDENTERCAMVAKSVEGLLRSSLSLEKNSGAVKAVEVDDVVVSVFGVSLVETSGTPETMFVVLGNSGDLTVAFLVSPETISPVLVMLTESRENVVDSEDGRTAAFEGRGRGIVGSEAGKDGSVTVIPIVERGRGVKLVLVLKLFISFVK